MSTIRIAEITEQIQVRSIQENIVEEIKGNLQSFGYKTGFPLTVKRVNGHYRLIDGNHRLKALMELGIEEVPVNIIETDEEEKEAWECNKTSETSAKATFVDYAEYVWKKAEEGLTQEKIAGVLGWSRDKIAKYIALDGICKEAWEMVVTTFECLGTDKEKEEGTTSVTTGTISERLLREIIQLKHSQQRELVERLIKDEIQKSKFKKMAQAYKHRNELIEKIRLPLIDIISISRYKFEEDCNYCNGIQDLEIATIIPVEGISHLVGIGPYTIIEKESPEDKEKREFAYKLILEAISKITAGYYDVDKNEEKLNQLIKAIRDKWEEKNNIQLINGDFYKEILSIPDNSIDLIITDPPYHVSNDRVFNLPGRKNISQDLGEWDKKPSREEELNMFKSWANQFNRIMKENSSGYIFCGFRQLSHIIDALENENLNYSTTIEWKKINPPCKITKRGYTDSIESIIFFTKGNYIFNFPGQNESHNSIETPICMGDERLKNSKGDTLHPTQKPEKVIKFLMENSSLPGSKVFDGFMGVGTTGKVAKDLNRGFIGIEREEEFFNAAKERILGQ